MWCATESCAPICIRWKQAAWQQLLLLFSLSLHFYACIRAPNTLISNTHTHLFDTASILLHGYLFHSAFEAEEGFDVQTGCLLETRPVLILWVNLCGHKQNIPITPTDMSWDKTAGMACQLRTYILYWKVLQEAKGGGGCGRGGYMEKFHRFHTVGVSECLLKVSWNKTRKAFWTNKNACLFHLSTTFKKGLKKKLNVGLKHNLICKQPNVKRLLEASSGRGIALSYQSISSSFRSISFV